MGAASGLDHLGRFDHDRFRARLLAASRAAGYRDVPAIAEALGVSKRALYYYLSNRRVPSVSTVSAIADVLGVSVDWLLGADERKMLGATARAISIDRGRCKAVHHPVSRPEVGDASDEGEPV